VGAGVAPCTGGVVGAGNTGGLVTGNRVGNGVAPVTVGCSIVGSLVGKIDDWKSVGSRNGSGAGIKLGNEVISASNGGS